MAAPEVTRRREEWRAGFDPRAPRAPQLTRPFAPAWQLAIVMGLSESSVYAHGAQYDALLAAGDYAGASRFVPCIVNGRSKRFPTAAFVSWWESAGAVTLRALCSDREAVAS
jgi:hypothetical protein